MRTVEAAVAVNEEQKTKLIRKASDRLITFNGLKVAVLGLTFKPGTDDLREAPSLDNIPLLLEAGANIVAYDPVGEMNFRRLYPEGSIMNGTIRYVRSPEDALKGANICFLFTEWPEIKRLTAQCVKDLMHTPLIYDGRNLFKTNEMKLSGVEYYSIGR